MAVISGYASLQTAVADYLARSDLTTWIPNFVQNFEERFYRNPLNYGPWMNTGALSVSFSSTATVPTDFLAGRSFYLNGQSQQPLAVMSYEQMLLKYPRTKSGLPKAIARDGASWIFGPVPAATYTLNGSYYAKPTLLRSFAADAAAHYLIVNAPDLLLYGALLEAQSFLKEDDRLLIWKNFHDEALTAYRELQRSLGWSGGSLQVLVA